MLAASWALVVITGACAQIASKSIEQHFGSAQVRDRVAVTGAGQLEYHADAKPILDKRCVACHACYDAPCQLQLGSHEGIDRGANSEKVYNASRILASTPSRLFIDEQTTAAWRERNFFPVLNERNQDQTTNLQASLLYRMLQLKRDNPHQGTALLPDDLITGTSDNHACARLGQFDAFAKAHPQRGMPYGLPAVSASEFRTLFGWLRDGATVRSRPPLDAATGRLVSQWEQFLNQESLQAQLMSRYIFEHLFLAHFYFGKPNGQQPAEYFRLVRSRTPPGEPVQIIATRRPYENPGAGPFYYRLWREQATVVVKTHLPYALNPARMKRWKELFLSARAKVDSLPSYATEIAANPFKAFKDIPVDSRYRFLLDEAQFAIMSFIKGPVCRGQVAVNVINDRFWVFFVNPDHPSVQRGATLIEPSSDLMRLPIEEGSNASPLSVWLKYASLQKERIRASQAFLKKEFTENESIDLDLIWDGGGNKNAALTVFRHADNATVLQGLVGAQPKTAWVIGYPLLEKIHYLLVAGYDVFGNLGHNVNSRLYMDFLRMEGEFSFLAFLPADERLKERDYWYRNALLEVEEFIRVDRNQFNVPSAVPYRTDRPKAELFDLLSKRLDDSMNRSHEIETVRLSTESIQQLNLLDSTQGAAASFMPEFSYLTVVDGSRSQTFSLMRNTALANVAYLFGEERRRLPTEDSITVAAGFAGSYPNAFFRVDVSRLDDFVSKVQRLNGADAYASLLDTYGVRRTNPGFWAHSDSVHQHFRESEPLEFGILDYNRLENR